MKPIYVIGHNPNTLAEADAYLSRGANAIEPDINIISGTNQLCVSHGEGNKDTITIDDYFTGLSKLKSHNNLALVYLDCKPAVINYGKEILEAVRRHLASDIKIVLSVASMPEAKIFPPLVWDGGSLRDNEYCLVDEENDPQAVANFFKGWGVKRFGYGNGDSVPLVPTTIFFPHVETSIRKACWMREQGDFSFVFSWTFNSTTNQNYFLKAGVDGIIVDLNGFPCVPGLSNMLGIIKSNSQYKLADRSDPL
jgi:hypothetical protein